MPSFTILNMMSKSFLLLDVCSVMGSIFTWRTFDGWFMQKALLIVLTSDLCVHGGVADLPQNINILVGFHGLFQHFMEHTYCLLWSCTHTSTLAELLRRLLPPMILNGYLHIVGVDNSINNKHYPNHSQLLKLLLSAHK